MRIFRHYEDLPDRFRGASIAVGNFDGVHLGHRTVIGEAGRIARAGGIPWAVLTLEPHPRSVFKRDAPPFRLTPFRLKARLIEEIGPQVLIVIHFDLAFSHISARDFVRQVLVESSAAQHVVCGHDFAFGHGREGNSELLLQMGGDYGFGFTCVREIRDADGKPYSSTRIREYLTSGKPAAAARARLDGRDFVQRRIAAVGRSRLRGRPPLFVAPYDAELFGHWWFEGPRWLEQVIRAAAAEDTLELISPSDYLERHPVLPRADPSPSTWGEGGYNRFWLNGENAWLYPQLHQAAREMRELAVSRPAAPGSLERRALNQAARSLLLAQASDWPFIIRSGGSADYARRRIAEHLSRFRYLQRALTEGPIDPRRLDALEQLDSIFPELDYRVFGE